MRTRAYSAHPSIRGHWALRWRNVCRLEAGQSQAVVARSLHVVRKGCPGCKISSNQLQMSPVRLVKTATEHQHLHRIAI
ncbi:hypothetical protein TNCV_1863041 [Trichonephila clavipes]|nr:hypothetical protein TNCV_1863041 [Trichonephila clavipes]